MNKQSNFFNVSTRIIVFLTGLGLIAVNFLTDILSPFSSRGLGKLQILVLILGGLICVFAFAPLQWILLLKRIVISVSKWICNQLNKLFLWAYNYYLMEVMAFLSISWLYLRNAIHYTYPVGYAGLYVLFTNMIIDHQFVLPNWVPYYGPGGIPFAYPPLGFYLAGLVHRLFNISIMDYVRFAPPVWTLFAVAAVYGLIRQMSTDRIKAVLGAFFFGATLEIYNYHATAAGIVRGPALLWTILTLTGLWVILRKKSNSIWIMLLTGIGMAFTAMTHLAYLTFLIMTAGLLLLSNIEQDFFQRLGKLAAISTLGAVLSSPWWGTMIARYGIEIFVNSSSSHGTLNIIGRIVSGEGGQVFTSLFSSWGGIPLIGLVLLGIVYTLWQRSYLLPIWYLTTFLFIGETDRFLMLIGAIMAACMIVSLAKTRNLSETHAFKNLLQWVLPIFFLLAFIWGQLYARITTIEPVLNSSLEQAATWMQNQTDPDARYLFFSDNHDMAEWLPYLTQRTPAVGQWGAEWLGVFSKRYIEWNQIANCAKTSSITCMEQLTGEQNLKYNYVIVPNSNELITNDFENSPQYDQVYRNDRYLIYKTNE